MSPQGAARGVSIVRTRKLFTFAMNLVGFGSLAGSGEVNPLIVAAFLISVFAAWFWEAPRVNFSRWQTPWTVLTVLVFGWTLLDIVFISDFFLTSAMHFVIFLAGAKLFQLAENKDFTQSMALSLLLLASGSVLNDQLSFGIAFMVYVVLATLALTVQHLNVEVSEQHPGRQSKFRVERVILLASLGLSTLIFIGSLAFFFAFPRIGFGLFMQNSRGGVPTSGFGDTVELGGHGTIREDATIVMRVVFPFDAPDMPQALYFRGISLDTYDGWRWHDNQDDTNNNVARDTEGRGYLINNGNDGTWEEAVEDTIVMDVYLEPLDSDVLFSIGQFRAIGLPDDITDLPDSWFGRSLQADETGEVSLRQRSSQGVMYRSYSRQNVPSLGDLRAARYSEVAATLPEVIDLAMAHITEQTGATPPNPDVPLAQENLDWIQAQRGPGNRRRRGHAAIAENLQLAEGLITPRMEAWVDEIRSANPLDVDFALALQQELQAMQYTTDLPQPSGPNANVIDEFLFEWQRGHCEYFATAMVIALREGGVPARIVNGFLGADYNEVGGFYAVRQANAHSWVEVHFAEHGWVRFDPTPAGAASAGPAGPFRKIQELIDSLRLSWFRWVVEYDAEKQVNAVRGALDAMQGDEQGENRFQLDEWIQGTMRWVWRHILACVGFFFFWMAATGVYRRRALNRMPWSGFDTFIAMAWTLAAAGVFWRFWPEHDWIGMLAAFAPIALTVFIAWQLRNDLFDLGGGRKGRSRSGDVISLLYARVIQTAERELGELPLSLSADELPSQLDLRDEDAQRELDAFLDVYERVRFAGEVISEDEAKAWRKRMRPMLRAIRRDLREQLRAE